MRDSTGPTVRNIVKAGAPFIHNFGFNNTFIGSGAGNFTMTHPFGSNTATGFQALHSNINGFNNTASGFGAIVNASNKIRLGNEAVTVIEGLVGLTARLWSVGSARTAEPGYKRFLHGG